MRGVLKWLSDKHVAQRINWIAHKLFKIKLVGFEN
jgi:hypothetical protein